MCKSCKMPSPQIHVIQNLAHCKGGEQTTFLFLEFRESLPSSIYRLIRFALKNCVKHIIPLKFLEPWWGLYSLEGIAWNNSKLSIYCWNNNRVYDRGGSTCISNKAADTISGLISGFIQECCRYGCTGKKFNLISLWHMNWRRWSPNCSLALFFHHNEREYRYVWVMK